ncbi:hypothetical protein [Paludibaculum fermentans]|uniref:hypothetical protein n=1 Tax=Paludibaculum fermentans TaxID=1473598 RepID=UPI003EC1319B
MILRSLMLAVVCAAVAFAADVTGKWTAEFDTQIGTQKYTYDFKVDGPKLTGTIKGGPGDMASESEVKEGKVTGDEISFVEVFKMEGNEIRIDYKGKVSADSIKFTRKVADFATEEFTAKRAK